MRILLVINLILGICCLESRAMEFQEDEVFAVLSKDIFTADLDLYQYQDPEKFLDEALAELLQQIEADKQAAEAKLRNQIKAAKQAAEAEAEIDVIFKELGQEIASPLENTYAFNEALKEFENFQSFHEQQTQAQNTTDILDQMIREHEKQQYKLELGPPRKETKTPRSQLEFNTKKSKKVARLGEYFLSSDGLGFNIQEKQKKLKELGYKNFYLEFLDIYYNNGADLFNGINYPRKGLDINNTVKSDNISHIKQSIQTKMRESNLKTFINNLPIDNDNYHPYIIQILQGLITYANNPHPYMVSTIRFHIENLIQKMAYDHIDLLKLQEAQTPRRARKNSGAPQVKRQFVKKA